MSIVQKSCNNSAAPLTPEQARELGRRLADHEANPDDVVPLDDVRAALAKQLGIGKS
jgi:putative addiction module component (TIGR02574 family)